MTRYKKELRKRGYKLECDYPWLPYGTPALECVRTYVYENVLVMVQYFVVGNYTRIFNRNFDIIEQYFD